MADDRIVVTSRGLSRIPGGEDGIPIEEVYPGETLPGTCAGRNSMKRRKVLSLENRSKGRTTRVRTSRSGFRPDRIR